MVDHQDNDQITTFITSRRYVVGVGETLDDVQTSGEWIATENPVDVPP